MYEEESKELSSTMKSLEILGKLPPSKRRDSIINKIHHWLGNHVSDSKQPVLDLKTSDSLNWLFYLENQCDRRGILSEISSNYRLTSRGTGSLVD